MRIGDTHIPRQRIDAFCRSHNVRRLSVFGSAMAGDLHPESDVDVLVEFAPGQTPSLLELGGMQAELTAMIGREVDLKTPGFLSKRILEHVRRTAEVQYAP